MLTSSSLPSHIGGRNRLSNAGASPGRNVPSSLKQPLISFPTATGDQQYEFGQPDASSAATQLNPFHAKLKTDILRSGNEVDEESVSGDEGVKDGDRANPFFKGVRKRPARMQQT